MPNTPRIPSDIETPADEPTLGDKRGFGMAWPSLRPKGEAVPREEAWPSLRPKGEAVPREEAWPSLRPKGEAVPREEVYDYAGSRSRWGSFPGGVMRTPYRGFAPPQSKQPKAERLVDGSGGQSAAEPDATVPKRH